MKYDWKRKERKKVDWKASQLSVTPHKVSRRHLRKDKSLSTQDGRWGRVHRGFIRHNAKVVQRGKKTLVLTFPFCIPVSARGSWAVGVLFSVLPGPLLRRTLELGAAPCPRMPRFWQRSAGSENIHFSLTPLRHTLHMEKPKFGPNGDIANTFVESPTA